MYVLPLEEIRSEHRDLVGSKAANLGELLTEGFPVPVGFVITAAAYDEAVAAVAASGDNGRAGGGALAARLHSHPVAAALREEILNAYRELQARQQPPLICAVRSSATAEDLPDASFAGQHATYYYVGEDTLMEMVQQCWASLWRDEAVAYRSTHGIDGHGVSMAVIVQKMIAADVSGVTFTANPVTGEQSQILTDASWGMGAAIVDGRVSPDSYSVNRATGQVLHHRITDKKFRLPAGRASTDVHRMEEVPPSMRRREALTDEQLARVTDLAARVERHFGAPQDVEWSLEGDRLFLLQSRPITNLGHRGAAPDPPGKYVLFKPLVENFTEPLTPLTGDLLINNIPFLALIRGRAYLNLRHVSAFLPFRLSEREIADLVYMSGDPATKFRIALRKVPLALAIYGVHFLTFAVLNARTRALPDDFMASFRAYATRILEDESTDAHAALDRLFAGARFFEPAGNMVLLINLTSGRYFWRMALLDRLLNRWLPGLPPDSASVLCSGGDGILSTAMGRAIRDLAAAARADADVSSLLTGHAPETAWRRLQAEFEDIPFQRSLREFLAVHGHRALKEFELSSFRWAENPVYVLGMVRNHLGAASEAGSTDDSAATRRSALEARVIRELAALPLENLLGLRWRLIHWLRERCRYFIKLRENSRFYHIMALQVVRAKVLQLEQELLRAGKLTCTDDIFYLLWREIEGLRDGALGWRDVETRIRARRLEHVRQSKVMPPRTIGLPPVDARDPRPAALGTLQGIGASPGIYEGIARVIRDPSINAELHPGEILVAPYTDPAWTPLFLTAHAAVVEVGSYLSHAGTIAREYGMPCVVDVADCTSVVATGDRLLVDGVDGIVRILERAAGARRQGQEAGALSGEDR